jgi:ABC-type transport system substrate-binding protein
MVDDQAVPDWDNQQALVIFEQILTAAEGNITGVFAANDGLANSVISALKSAGIDPGDAGIPISGQDATVAGIQHVLAGDQAMSTYKPIKAEAEAAAEAAIALFKGEDVAALAGGTMINNGQNDIPFIALVPIPVTKDKVADTVIADGFRTWEELCVGDFQQYCPEDQGGMAAAEEPAEEEAMPEGPAVVSADGCEYGGKIESIVATGEHEVVFNLCKPDPTFLAKMGFTPFGIQPSEHIEATGGGGDLLESPIGTGAYKLDSWNRGDSIIYSRFDDYWGEPAIADTLVFRWATESASRLLELQAGSADYMKNIGPDDYATVEADPNLELVPQDNPNILYIAMTNTFEPFDNVDVRKAIGMGIDRQRIVDNFYPEGSEVASHFTPCSIPSGCEGEEWYEFDAAAAKQMLADAGFPDGFDTTIYYRDVFRTYLPEPGAVAVELQTQLADNLGINAEVVVMESGEFIDESTNGRLDGIYLLGWGADYPHVINFLDFHFSEFNPQFGDPNPEIYEPLYEASSIGDPAVAAPLYEQANNAIKELVPMVPAIHGATSHAARAGLPGMNNPPFGAPIMGVIDPGKDTLVFMKNAEPISLYCSDETDGESLDSCQQVIDGLYNYDVNGASVPALAEVCEPNEDGTVWTCTLRQGVKFHDGSDFDSADVIASFGAGIDASNPLHVGNTGAWEYYSYLWDGLMNQSE